VKRKKAALNDLLLRLQVEAGNQIFLPKPLNRNIRNPQMRVGGLKHVLLAGPGTGVANSFAFYWT